jgi:magnesium transporter
MNTIVKGAKIGKDAVNSLLHTIFQERTRAVIHPFKIPEEEKKHELPFHLQIFSYNNETLEDAEYSEVEPCLTYRDKNAITWLNLDSFHTQEMEQLAEHYGIHPLIQEDIMSYGQRPKMDEVNEILFVLLNMLFYNDETKNIEQEQISIVLGKNFIISIQEDALRDVFNPIRIKLKNKQSKIRQSQTDYLFYTMIDIIVDSYFHVIEKIGDRIEKAEEELLTQKGKRAFNHINLIRKDLILLKRNTTPVRDLIASILRSDSDLLEDNTTKYYKDVYDHIMQANDLVDNYRDLVNTLQDMYFNNVNLKMNEVMKTLAIVTTFMAPATVIGGIFGMNFDIIPYAHHRWGFYATVAFMFMVPITMIWWFSRRGWFTNEDPYYKQK